MFCYHSFIRLHIVPGNTGSQQITDPGNNDSPEATNYLLEL